MVIDNISVDEHMDALTERLKPTGFVAFYVIGRTQKSISRPWRIAKSQNSRDSSIRYFHDLSKLVGFAEKLIDNQSRVDTINVNLKMFDVDADVKIRWKGCKCWFDLAIRTTGSHYVDSRTKSYDRINVLEERCHEIIQESQQHASV